jgi:hypothetical protein
MGNKFYAWPEHVIDAYIEALVVGCAEAETTAIAERGCSA